MCVGEHPISWSWPATVFARPILSERRHPSRGMRHVFGCGAGEDMDRAAHFRRQANHARQLADATHKGDVEDLLRRLAKGYDEVAHDIETGANEIRHAELLDGGWPSY